MEEIRCCLLGFSSVSLRAVRPTAGGEVAAQPPPLLPVPVISDALRAQLHQSELFLLESTLPLGGAYAALRDFANAAATAPATSSHAHTSPRHASLYRGPSTHRSLYASALRVGVKEVLTHYVDAVKSPALSSTAALSDLEATFGPTMRSLVELAHTASCVEASLASDGASEPRLESDRGASKTDTTTQTSQSTAPYSSPAASKSVKQSHATVPLFLQQWDTFVRHEGLPPAFRACIGESIWLSVLFTTAHFIAHGVVLHGRRDFFLQPARTSTGPQRSRSGEYVLVEAYVPSGISFDLALSVLAAGRERQMLLAEAAVDQHRATGLVAGGGLRRGHRGQAPGSAPPMAMLTSLAMGAQDEVAEAVFHAIFQPSLCEGGRLTEEELSARVDAARSLWSKALWIKVKDPYGVLSATASARPPPSGSPLSLSTLGRRATSTPTLFHHLNALQDMFLCQRGDIWHHFVERVYATVTASPGSGASGVSAGGGGALAMAETNVLLYRRAEESFMAALSEAGLADDAAYVSFSMHVADDCPSMDAADATNTSPQHGGRRRGRSSEELATAVLERVEAFDLHYARPTSGLGLVVTDKTVSYYRRLFSSQLRLRVAFHALYQTRHDFTEALLSNTSPSAELRRAFKLLHLLLFMVSALRDYADVDVTAPAIRELTRAVEQCRSVAEAKRHHDQFIWSLAEGCFLTDTSEALRRACREVCRCALVLHLVCRRYGLVYWAVEGVNEVPPEVAAVLTALETRVQQSIIAVFLGHLGAASRAGERALWVRLDFNRHFSQGLRLTASQTDHTDGDGGRSGRSGEQPGVGATPGQYAGVAAASPSLRAHQRQSTSRRSSASAAVPTRAERLGGAKSESEDTRETAVPDGPKTQHTLPRTRTPTRVHRRGSAAVSTEAPATSSAAPATHTVLSLPAVRHFATAAYPGGVAPPQSNHSGSSHSSTKTSATGSSVAPVASVVSARAGVGAAAHVVAAIAARQAAVTAASSGMSHHAAQPPPTPGRAQETRERQSTIASSAALMAARATSTRHTYAKDEESASSRSSHEPTVASIATSAAARASRSRVHTATSTAPVTAPSTASAASHVDAQAQPLDGQSWADGTRGTPPPTMTSQHKTRPPANA